MSYIIIWIIKPKKTLKNNFRRLLRAIPYSHQLFYAFQIRKVQMSIPDLIFFKRERLKRQWTVDRKLLDSGQKIIGQWTENYWTVDRKLLDSGQKIIGQWTENYWTEGIQNTF